MGQPPRHPSDASPLCLCPLVSLSGEFQELGSPCLSVCSGIWLFLLSIIRKQINWPRPYEIGMLPPLLDREGKGSSMPSRHVFSAAIISIVAWGVNPILSILGMSLALLLAGVRVLAGLHFVRDVVVGFVVALLWGIVSFSLLGIF